MKADDEMVRLGIVKQVDEDGGDRLDGAADQAGKRAGAHIMDVRRMFTNLSFLVSCSESLAWVFFIFVDRVVVNDDYKERKKSP